MLRLLFGLALASTISAEWEYNRCALDGPNVGWTGTCPGELQGSPINLCGAQPYTQSMNATGYDAYRNMTIKNPGHTIQIGIISDPPTLQVGNISALVGRGTQSTPITWKMEQAHVHFGRVDRNDEGSEHYIEGVRYPLEIHLVHYNSIYSNVTAALNSGAKDAVLVVGILFQLLGATDVLSNISTAATNATSTATQLDQLVQLSAIFDPTGDFYFYAGSLTTPACTEEVTWVVMKQPQNITLATLTTFKRVAKDPTASPQVLIAADGNFRPLQNRSGRPVYLTGSSNSSACGAVTEPTWTCAASPPASSSPSPTPRASPVASASPDVSDSPDASPVSASPSASPPAAAAKSPSPPVAHSPASPSPAAKPTFASPSPQKSSAIRSGMPTIFSAFILPLLALVAYQL